MTHTVSPTNPSTNSDIASSSSTASSSSHKHNPRAHLIRDALLILACTLGIYTCFLGYGLIQENIYTRRYGTAGEKFRFSLFLVFMQCVGNCMFSVICAVPGYLKSSIPPNRVPPLQYVGISFSYVGAMFLSNLALGFMSYPAQALAKSIKLIPVMLMRIVVLRHKYSVREYLQVALITMGIVVFMAVGEGEGKSKKHAHGGGGASEEEGLIPSWLRPHLGLLLCVASLLLDGFTSPTQEKINREFKPTMFQMQFWLNFYAILMVGVVLLSSGEGPEAIAFVARYPELIGESLLFGLLSAIGQAVILFTILRFNSLVVVTITTTRKFFTILFSVVLYGHVLSATQWSGVALVFAGLGLDIYHKYTSSGGVHKQIHKKTH